MKTMSKFLGYGLVLGGAIVKIPQVIKIVMNKSVFGISYQSIILETLTNWITIIYSWYNVIPFSIYGENVFLLVQNLLIMAFFCFYSPRNGSMYAIPLLVCLLGIFLTSNPGNWPLQIINSTMYLQITLCTI